MTNHNFEEEYNIPDTFQINSYIELKLEVFVIKQIYR
ncbi:hypothetical protein LCGC14_2022100 [marine sediment metagenome]|uniref:Uncharacterized protein n=1 Tax=marine sediment metagenome TaxID=412755 RepID=A0A0F9HAH4_9ZZZZ